MPDIIFTLPVDNAPPQVVSAPEGTYAHNPSHVEEAYNNLIDFFKRPRNQVVLDAVGGEVQEVEDAIYDIHISFDVDTAVGLQLDFLGKLVGEYRNDRTDDNYRAAVRVRILVNSSDGKVEQLLEIVSAMLPFASSIIYQEQYPAAFTFDITDDFSGATPASVALMVRQAKPAGVGFHLVVTTATSMIWHPDGPDATNGWGADWAGAF